MKGYSKRIYLSATWKGDRRAETVQIANLIANNGVTVVRDHESNNLGDPLRPSRTWVNRIDAMLNDCSGLVVVLPYKAESPQTTSPFLIPELLAADAQGIPILLFANPGVAVKRVTSARGIEFEFPNVGQGEILNRDDVVRWKAGQESELDETLMGAAGFVMTNPHHIPNHVLGPFVYPNSEDHRATKNAIEDFVESCPNGESLFLCF